MQPYDSEVGAGTFHTATLLRSLGKQPWRACYPQPCRRPADEMCIRDSRWAMSLRHQRGALRRVAQRRLCRTCEYACLLYTSPSVVAIDKNDERILAVGIEAKRMLGRTPGNIVAVRPLKDGVIADFDVTEAMLRYFIDKASEKRYPWTPRPRVVVCVPSGVTSVEKRAVFEATIQAGARQAYLIEEPMACLLYTSRCV